MVKFTQKLRDWWRGYSDSDIKSAREAIFNTPLQLGAITYLSRTEFKAYLNHGMKIIGDINGKANHSNP